jgi:26S proteasome regulatory subunit T4
MILFQCSQLLVVGREYVVEDDFMKAARKIAESKKLESKMDYSKV